jgi:hypothetical protein
LPNMERPMAITPGLRGRVATVKASKLIHHAFVKGSSEFWCRARPFWPRLLCHDGERDRSRMVALQIHRCQQPTAGAGQGVGCNGEWQPGHNSCVWRASLAQPSANCATQVISRTSILLGDVFFTGGKWKHTAAFRSTADTSTTWRALTLHRLLHDEQRSGVQRMALGLANCKLAMHAAQMCACAISTCACSHKRL